ncbi:PaaI family thioesterase [Patescibacteria group bacterium]|nr:PaaI family thioesterase [Patescibacteria group bacterium]MBU1890549.1 PaaI family thioesterase [Patescibacteria group bacterium]
MSEKPVTRPTELTSFAQLLGITRFGNFFADSKTYIIRVTPTQEIANLFGTVHGGYLASVIDDSAGMLIFFLYGVNSAITARSSPIEMKRAPRLNQPLTFTMRVTKETKTEIWVMGEVRDDAGRLVALTSRSSRWCKRTRRR